MKMDGPSEWSAAGSYVCYSESVNAVPFGYSIAGRFIALEPSMARLFSFGCVTSTGHETLIAAIQAGKDGYAVEPRL